MFGYFGSSCEFFSTKPDIPSKRVRQRFIQTLRDEARSPCQAFLRLHVGFPHDGLRSPKSFMFCVLWRTHMVIFISRLFCNLLITYMYILYIYMCMNMCIYKYVCMHVCKGVYIRRAFGFEQSGSVSSLEPVFIYGAAEQKPNRAQRVQLDCQSGVQPQKPYGVVLGS